MTKRVLLLVLVAFAWLTPIFAAPGPVRVALMDFATEKNSYRSLQAAADLGSLVQTKLGSLPELPGRGVPGRAGACRGS